MSSYSILKPSKRRTKNQHMRYAVAIIAACVATPLIVSPAQAQFSDSYNFLKAVKKRDYAEAKKQLDKPGFNLNTKEYSTGDTALHISTRNRYLKWVNLLLKAGASPNVRNKEGQTPLMLAVQNRLYDGARLLIAKKANVDETNNRGETALINAVHFDDITMVRLLLKVGASPDKADTLAGLSARDYAKRDRRKAEILIAIEKSDAAKKAKKGTKPQEKIDFSGPLFKPTK